MLFRSSLWNVLRRWLFWQLRWSVVGEAFFRVGIGRKALSNQFGKRGGRKRSRIASGMSGNIVEANNAMIDPAMLRLIMCSFLGKDFEKSSDIGIPAERKNYSGASLFSEYFSPSVYEQKVG